MKMTVDQALRKGRTLPKDAAQALYGEMLARFPGNKRLQAAVQDLNQVQIVNPPEPALQAILDQYGAGRADQAFIAARILLAEYPNSEILHNITGAVCAALDRNDDAITHYDRALALAPDYFEAWNNRGNTLNILARPEEALASFDRALALNPDYADALVNRGATLFALKRLDDALASYNRAIRLNPDRPEALNNRGNTLVALRRAADALADYDKALALRPDYIDARINRGNAQKIAGQRDEALVTFTTAIAHAPGHAPAHIARADLLRERGRLDEALGSYQLAHSISPSIQTRNEIANVQAHMCIWTDSPPDLSRAPAEAIPPFYAIRLTDDAVWQRDNARAWTARHYGHDHPATFRSPSRDGKIRIGYFSSDFHHHATLQLMIRMFELHDRDRFEIHAFSYGPYSDDALRQRLLACVDAFHDIESVSDEAAAQLARDRGIDIAVDLKGHTEGTRMAIFAHRAAPIQVAYLGYPGTSGADFIDVIIADRIVLPPEHQHAYSEQVAYLPHSYQSNDVTRTISTRSFTRTELSLPQDGFVFCSFNSNYKITRDDFAIWMTLLNQVEGSVLWLLKSNDWSMANMRAAATAHGIDPARLIFADPMPLADHLARHRLADLFLDSFAINAHTTASDALWAGLPVVTKLGSSFVSRVAGSLLHALDLPELVTETGEAYAALALDLATHPEKLADVKSKLAEKRTTAPLFDSALFTRDIENLYRDLFQQKYGQSLAE